MPVIIDYILKLSVCLAVVYLFYQLFLRRLTFYNWNRWYLLGYGVLSFIIPLIDVMPELQKKELDRSALVQMIPTFGFASDTADTSLLESLSVWDWVMVAAALGSLALLLRFFIMFLSFMRVKKRAQLISDAHTRIYQLDEDIRPFSFGNAIFINTELHSGEELEEIIRHEFVHVRQKHTIDIIWSELLCILLWFNPFVWLLRKSLKQNLEFLADKQVLQNGMDKKEYQYLLLKVMGNRQFAFANHFNFSSLKNRIAMMNTIKSAKVHLTKFLFLLPVVAVLLLAFRKEIKNEFETRGRGLAEQRSSVPMARESSSETGGVDNVVLSFPEQVASANALKNPVYFLDSKPVNHKALNHLTAATVGSVSILNQKQALKKYGRKGENGAVEIFSKSFVSDNSNLYYYNNTGLQIKPGRKDTVPPLYVIDGEKRQSGSTLAGLNPEAIESFSVLKGTSATSLYGADAKNGVVIITTKKGTFVSSDSSRHRLELRYVMDSSNVTGLPLQGKVSGVRIVAKGNVSGLMQPGGVGKMHSDKGEVTLGDGFDGVYVVDGKVRELKSLRELPPDHIQSINVFKGGAAKEVEYGEKAKNGVIEIHTKKPDDEKPAPKPVKDQKEVVVVGYGLHSKRSAPAKASSLSPVKVVGYGQMREQKSLPAVTIHPATSPENPEAKKMNTLKGEVTYSFTEKSDAAKSDQYRLVFRANEKATAASPKIRTVTVKDTIKIYDKLDLNNVF
ncbi:M56 family metallopeptidase [Niabella hirudinis]|uniref:M56 family metallopeptidase n=1 Tax=Niabella hirudinis TaxID=1285929 RepID=UPI003EBDD13F